MVSAVLGMEAQKSYDWNSVDSLLEHELFAQARGVVAGYLDDATKESLGYERINAAYYLAMIDHAKMPNAFDSVIARYALLEREGCVRSLATALLVHEYVSLLSEMRYTVHRNEKSNDPSLSPWKWDKGRFEDTIGALLVRMLPDLSELEALDGKLRCFTEGDARDIELALIDDLMSIGGHTLRFPSLYEDSAILNALSLPLTELADYTFSDTASDIVRFFSGLAQLYKNDAPERRLRLDLSRLILMSDLYRKSAFWVEALSRLVGHYEGCSVEPSDMGELYYLLGENLCKEDRLVEAHETFLLAERRSPNTNVASRSGTARLAMEMPKLDMTVQEVEHSQSNRMAMVHYKNLSRLQLRIVKREPWMDTLEMQDLRDTLCLLPPVREWFQTLPAYEDYQFHEALFAIPMLPMGEYFLLCSDEVDSTGTTFGVEGNVCYCSIQSANTMLVACSQMVSKRRFRNGCGWLLDRASGLPIAHKKVYREWEGEWSEKIHHRGIRTDGKGYFDFRITGYSNQLYVSYEGFKNYWDDLYMGGMLWDETGSDVAVFLDKPIYKLGEEVKFSCLAYKSRMKSGYWRYDYRLIKDKYLDVYLMRDYSDTVEHLRLTTDEWGQCSGSFVIPQEGRNGTYSLKVVGKGIYYSEAFQVEDYKLPRFDVSISYEGARHSFGKPIVVKGAAVAYNGGSMEGSEVYYSVTAYYEGEGGSIQLPEGKTVVERDGTFEFTFVPLPKQGDKKESTCRFKVSVRVTALDGESHTAYVSFRVGPYGQSVDLDRNTNDDTLRIRYSTIDNHPLEGPVRVVVKRLQQPSVPKLRAPMMQWFPNAVWAGSEAEFHQQFPHYAFHREEWDSSLWNAETKVLDTLMEGRCIDWSSNRFATGYYRITLSVGDSISQERVVRHKNRYDHLPLASELFTPRSSPEVCKNGDTVRIELSSSYTNQPVFYKAVIGDKELIRGMVVVNDTLSSNKTPVLEIPVTRKMEGNIAVYIVGVRENVACEWGKEYYIVPKKGFIEVEAESFRDKLRPGDQEQWCFKVSGAENNQANLLLTLYDKTLEEVSKEEMNVRYFPNVKYNTFIQGGVDKGRKVSSRELHFRRNLGYDEVDSLEPKRVSLIDPLDYLSILLQISDSVSLALLKPGGGIISCVVRDAKTEEELPFVNVAVKRLGTIVAGAQTDFDGHCFIKGLVPGRYDLEVTYVGYRKLIVNVDVEPARFTKVFAELHPSAVQLNEIMVVDSRTPLIDIGGPENGIRISEEDVVHMGGMARGEDHMVAMSGNVVKSYSPDTQSADYGSQRTDHSMQLRENLSTSAFFMPSLHTDDSGRVCLTFSVPESFSQWSLLGVAWDKNLKNGVLSLATCTQKELMVQPQVPRFFRQGDTADFSARVSNLTDTAQQVMVTFAFGSTDSILNSQFSIQKLSASTFVPAHGSSTVSFRIYVPDTLNSFRYRVSARSDRYSDGEQASVPILGNRVRISENHSFYINGKNAEILEKRFPLSNFNHLPTGDSSDSLLLRFCSNPIGYALEAAPHLSKHRSPSNLYIANCIYANAVEYLAKDEDTHGIVQLLLGQLYRNQSQDGGWSWLSGGKSESDPYVSRRILQRLGEMSSLNDAIPVKRLRMILEKGGNFLAKQIRLIDNDTTRSEAMDYEALDYLYVYSLVASPEQIDSATSCSINRIVRKIMGQRSKIVSLRARAQLSLVALRLGDTALAIDEATRLKESAIVSDELGMYWRDNFQGLSWWNRSLETQALLVEVFASVLHDWESVAMLQQWILQQKRTTTWGSDMATVSAIHALLKHPHNTTINSQFSIHYPQFSIPNSQFPTNQPLSEVCWVGPEVAKIIQEKQEVKIATTGSSWGSISYHYEEQLDNVSHNEMGVKIDRKYYRINPDKSLTLVTDSTSLKKGDRVRVVIFLECDRNLDYLVLSDQRAASFEPIITQSGWRYNDGISYYSDIRNEESLFYINRLAPGHYAVEYDVWLMASGTFSTGIATIECNYAPEFRSNSRNTTLVVAN